MIAFKVRETLYEEVRPPKEDDVKETTTLVLESGMYKIVYIVTDTRPECMSFSQISLILVLAEAATPFRRLICVAILPNIYYVLSINAHYRYSCYLNLIVFS